MEEIIFKIKEEIEKDYNIKKPIIIEFIPSKDFPEKINALSLKDIGEKIIGQDEKVDGYLFINAKKDNIYLSINKEITPYNIQIFTHEMAHIITYPNINFKSIINKNNKYTLLGYNFWLELVATYLGNILFMKYDGILLNHVKIEEFISSTSKLVDNIYNKNDLISLYELLALLNISSFEFEKNNFQGLEKIYEYSKKLLSKNNLKNITVSELTKLGKLINKVNTNFGKEI